MRHFSALLTLLLLSAHACHAAEGERLTFESLSQGKTSALRNRIDFVVARSGPELASAWALPWTDQHGELAGQPSRLPVIDFRNDMVVGVVGPAAPSSCTTITIVQIRRDGGKVIVQYRGHKHTSDEVCLTAFHAPFAFARMRSTPLEIEFLEVPVE